SGSRGAERMEVGVSRASPVPIPDAELVGGLHLPDQVILGDAELADEVHDRGDRRLADPDRTDAGGLDQADLDPQALERLCQAGRSHPAGGAASNDGYVA